MEHESFPQLRPLAEARIAVVGHGVPEGPPARDVCEYLAREGAHLRCLFHPLGPEQRGMHVYEEWRDGVRRTRVVRLPSRPPLTYPFDLALPFARNPVDVWIGFNNLCAVRGIVRRGRGRVGAVVHWAIDFVPDRFGSGSPLTRGYEALDAFCCRHVDLRVEVSETALESRSKRYGLAADAAPSVVVPIGLWADKARRVPEDAHGRRRALFVGHLVERMGVATAIRAIAELRHRGSDVVLDVVGRGPERTTLEALAAELGVADIVNFHGYCVGAEFEDRLISSSVALAPYRDDGRSFTQFADPAKLKTYMAAGLPVVMTPVPPNANELADAGVADVVPDSPDAVAEAIARLIDNPEVWAHRRAAALRHAQRYDWPALLPPVLERVGFAAGGS